MKGRSSTVLVAACAAAFCASSVARRTLRAQEAMPNTASTPVAKYWMRMYPLEPYAEYWHLSVQVADLKTAVPKSMALLEKDGGQITLPLENFAASHVHKYQQLSYKLSSTAAQKAVKGLGRLGRIDELIKDPAVNAETVREVKEKLAKLRKEYADNKDAMARMPSVSALVKELTDHLALVSQVHQQAAGAVLLNIELHEPNIAVHPSK